MMNTVVYFHFLLFTENNCFELSLYIIPLHKQENLTSNGSDVSALCTLLIGFIDLTDVSCYLLVCLHLRTPTHLTCSRQTLYGFFELRYFWENAVILHSVLFLLYS